MGESEAERPATGRDPGKGVGDNSSIVVIFVIVIFLFLLTLVTWSSRSTLRVFLSSLCIHKLCKFM